jgi:hypothetical protein
VWVDCSLSPLGRWETRVLLTGIILEAGASVGAWRILGQRRSSWLGWVDQLALAWSSPGGSCHRPETCRHNWHMGPLAARPCIVLVGYGS